MGPTMASVISRVANLQKPDTANNRILHDTSTLYTATTYTATNITTSPLAPLSPTPTITRLATPPTPFLQLLTPVPPPSSRIQQSSPPSAFHRSTTLLDTSLTPKPQRPPRKRPPRQHIRPTSPASTTSTTTLFSTSSPYSPPPASQPTLLLPPATPQLDIPSVILPTRLALRSILSPTTSQPILNSNSNVLPSLPYKRRPALSQQGYFNSPQMRLRQQPTTRLKL